MKKLERYLDRLGELYRIPALDCIVMRRHETVFRHMAGHSDERNIQPVCAQNMWRFYSLTKPVTMIAILQLIEQGRLRLFDRVSDYLPEYEIMRVKERQADGSVLVRLAHTPIRIVDLMSMTSGITFDEKAESLMKMREKNGKRASTREVIRALAKEPLDFEPGSSWGYGFSHDVLAAVVEEITGISFGSYLKHHIFEPLGAEELYFYVPKQKKKCVAALYAYQGDAGIYELDKSENRYVFTDQYESGGAGLIGSVEAYARILDALANEGKAKNGYCLLTPQTARLLSESYLNEVQRREFRKICRSGYSYGLGVRVLTDQRWSKSPLGEFGWDGAAGAYALADQKNGVSIVYVNHVLNRLTTDLTVHTNIRDMVYEELQIS